MVHSPQDLPGAGATSVVSLLAARIDVAPLSSSTIFQPWAAIASGGHSNGFDSPEISRVGA